MLCAISLRQPTDPRFGAVTQFSTGANSHYNGLQLTAEKRMGHGLQGQVNYTWSHCIDTVSNGGFLQFSAGGILSPLPGDLARDYGPCDYDVRHNLTAQYVYRVSGQGAEPPLGLRAERLAGFRHRVLAQRSSLFGAEHAVFGEWKRHREGQRSAVREPCAGRAALRHNPIPGVTQPGTIQWLNPEAFVSAVDPSTGACNGGDTAANCQFGNLGRNALRGPDFVWSDFYLTKWFPLTEHVKLRVDAQFFNVFNHPNFGLPCMVFAGIPGKPRNANRLRRAHLHDLAAHWPAGRRPGRRQLPAHDRLPGPPRILSAINEAEFTTRNPPLHSAQRMLAWCCDDGELREHGHSKTRKAGGQAHPPARNRAVFAAKFGSSHSTH